MDRATRHKLEGVTKVRREKQPQRKARSHGMEKELKSQMRTCYRTGTQKACVQGPPNSFLRNQWPKAKLFIFFI